MKKTVLSLLMCSLLFSAAGAWAAGQMKPGLWEITMKSDAMKNMPKIPPEQLKKMREMGIDMPQMSDGGMVTKVCITKEMAERDQPMEMTQRETGCQTKNSQKTGNSYAADLVCDGPAMQGAGKIKGTLSGTDRFSSTYDFKGSVHGQPVNEHQESNGKWLAADCGSVKPMTGIMPKK